MKLQMLLEPDLEFGRGRHVCPRAGIAELDVYDSTLKVRRSHLWIGAIGVSDDLGGARHLDETLSGAHPG